MSLFGWKRGAQEVPEVPDLIEILPWGEGRPIPDIVEIADNWEDFEKENSSEVPIVIGIGSRIRGLSEETDPNLFLEVFIDMQMSAILWERRKIAKGSRVSRRDAEDKFREEREIRIDIMRGNAERDPSAKKAFDFLFCKGHLDVDASVLKAVVVVEKEAERMEEAVVDFQVQGFSATGYIKYLVEFLQRYWNGTPLVLDAAGFYRKMEENRMRAESSVRQMKK